MFKIISIIFVFLAAIVSSNEEQIHISQEERPMIFFRSLLINGCVSRIKYKILYEEMNQQNRESVLRDLDEILNQLGTSFPERSDRDL